MLTFNELKLNLKKDFSGYKIIKVAVLGDTATQFLCQALRGTGFNHDFDLQILEADFDQIEHQIFDLSSELYEFNPEVIIIFHSSHKLLGKYNKLSPEQYSSFADEQLNQIKTLVTTINEKLNSKIIYYNFSEIDDSVFGSYSCNLEVSFLFQLRKLNYELMLFSVTHSNFFICDIASVQNRCGRNTFFQPSIYVNTEMVLSIDSLPEVASRTVDVIGAFYGKIKKCIVLDLDNTLWGGVIGDDGLENIQIGSLGIGKAFTEFQYWLKKLKNRGIILTVCSKNTESIAKEPFEKHPDMVLGLEDIAVFLANWDNKVKNIRQIQNFLNIGFDSMVFLDDNPFERNMVKENIPELTVPEMPEDPADYLEYLYAQNLFETVSSSNEDGERTKQYQAEAHRSMVKQSFTDEDGFLESLDMLSVVEPFNKFNTPRVAQLSQRSNQFNLRTIRYSEADIEQVSISNDFLTFAFSLKDKFCDNGLICVVILRKEKGKTLFIESWFMSCRVLKRGMENFVLNTILATARKKGFLYLKGEYIQTAKNELVKNHYENLGFMFRDGYWYLNIQEHKEKKCFIKAHIPTCELI